MTDDPLPQLRADWCRQNIGVVAAKSRRWRQRAKLLIVLDVVAAVIALCVGMVFSIVAWETHDWLFGLSAVTLLLVCPPYAISLIRARRLNLNWEDQTPEGTLQHALKRTQAVNRILKIQFWNGIVLLCFVASIWICVWVGLISPQYPLVLMSGTWIVASVAALLWVKWRASRNAVERRQCEQLLSRFQEAERSEASFNSNTVKPAVAARGETPVSHGPENN
jgi:amino acid transporter